MRILIAFYTKKKEAEVVAASLQHELERRDHQVVLQKIVPQQAYGIVRRIWYWLFRKHYHILPVKVKDVSEFDLICLGSPTGLISSLPLVKYLSMLEGLEHKNVGVFTTAVNPPFIKKYTIFTYLLEAVYTWQVKQKGGKVIGFLNLSHTFKRWQVKGVGGKKRLRQFCNVLEKPVYSLKKYHTKQKEIADTRFLVIVFSFLALFSFLAQVVTSAFGVAVLGWADFWLVLLVEIFIYFILLTILTSQTLVFLGKYLAGLALVFGLTAGAMLLLPKLGGSIVLSYLLVLILFIFFRDFSAVLVSTVFIVLAYFYLYYTYPILGVFHLKLDLFFILSGAFLASYVAKNLQQSFLDLLEVQEEIEMARIVLKIKVDARTRELRELSESLEEQVIERTFSLQRKVEDLERFNKLTVGRELKMIELKEEIKNLETELAKYKNEKTRKVRKS